MSMNRINNQYQNTKGVEARDTNIWHFWRVVTDDITSIRALQQTDNTPSGGLSTSTKSYNEKSSSLRKVCLYQ